MRQLNIKGFAHSTIVMALVVVFGVGGVGYYLLRQSSAATITTGIALTAEPADATPQSIKVAWKTPALPEQGSFWIEFKKARDNAWTNTHQSSFETLTGSYRIAGLAANTNYQFRTAYDIKTAEGDNRRIYGPVVSITTQNNDPASLSCKTIAPEQIKSSNTLTIKYVVTNKATTPFAGEGFTVHSQTDMMSADGQVTKSWKLPASLGAKKSRTYSHNIEIPRESSVTHIGYFGQLQKGSDSYSSPAWQCNAGTHQVEIIK